MVNRGDHNIPAFTAGIGRGKRAGDRVHPPEERQGPHQQVGPERNASSLGNDQGAVGVGGTNRARQNNTEAVDEAVRSGTRRGDCSGVKFGEWAPEYPGYPEA